MNCGFDKHEKIESDIKLLLKTVETQVEYIGLQKDILSQHLKLLVSVYKRIDALEDQVDKLTMLILPNE